MIDRQLDTLQISMASTRHIHAILRKWSNYKEFEKVIANDAIIVDAEVCQQ